MVSVLVIFTVDFLFAFLLCSDDVSWRLDYFRRVGGGCQGDNMQDVKMNLIAAAAAVFTFLCMGGCICHISYAGYWSEES